MALPQTIEELDQIKLECEKMVTKRASASAAAAVIPILGTDVAADVAMMSELLPAINKKFGLSHEQVEELDQETKRVLLVMITSAGSELIGKVITKQVITHLLKKVSTKIAVKQVAKFIPFAGQAAAAGISFSAMKYLGNSHINDCYDIAKKYIEQQPK
ncbi:uncharacterized protein (DUF697 family) [Bacillus ectoiniformans]|uniref:hypothetical protein n=1 Tax=Bacillus ectoiniformans TaxID=1494429 RepID=UPI001956E12A|nr:hypothetical protein [Bacillus ectoiniformans]MBM7648695.1 uncharacterized protein (DUF697 family) [Bacillus ectoiniformans]